MKGLEDSYICEPLKWAVVDKAQDSPPRGYWGTGTTYAGRRLGG